MLPVVTIEQVSSGLVMKGRVAPGSQFLQNGAGIVLQ